MRAQKCAFSVEKQASVRHGIRPLGPNEIDNISDGKYIPPYNNGVSPHASYFRENIIFSLKKIKNQCGFIRLKGESR
jgi:hypothetical protein